MNWKHYFGSGVENAQMAKRAAARPLRARQDTSDSAAASATSGGATAKNTESSSETVAAASSLDTAAASETGAAAASSITSPPSGTFTGSIGTGTASAAALTSGLLEEGPHEIYVPLPPYTATSSTAYIGDGINATSKLVPTTTPPPQWPGLVQTTTSSTATPTHSIYVPPPDPYAYVYEPGVPNNVLTKCIIDGQNATYGPFCTPDYHQSLFVGLTYAFTWNPYLHPYNYTTQIQLAYDDPSLGNATVSNSTNFYLGFQYFELDEAWLQGADGNSSWSGQNLTVNLISTPPDGGADIVSPGPQIYLVRDPKSLPIIHYKKLAPKYGLEIGLPIGLIALIIIALSVWCAARRSNRQFASVRGAGRDYMARRARRRGHSRKGDIQLEEMDMGTEDSNPRYTDQPVRGGGNAFRDEIRRQQEGDDSSVKHMTSY